MPELPEVETIKRDLQKSIVGEIILGVQVNDKMVVRSSLPEDFRESLLNKKIIDVQRRGKAIILKFEKPGRFFMDLTNNAEKAGVSQAELALYFALRKKTFRFVKDNNQNQNQEKQQKEPKENNHNPPSSPKTTNLGTTAEEDTPKKDTSSSNKQHGEENTTSFFLTQDADSSSTSSSPELLKVKAARTIQCAERQRAARQLSKTKRFLNLEQKQKLEQEADHLTLLYATLKIQSIFRQKKSRGLVKTKRFVKSNNAKLLEEEAIDQEKKFLASGVLDLESSDDDDEDDEEI